MRTFLRSLGFFIGSTISSYLLLFLFGFIFSLFVQSLLDISASVFISFFTPALFAIFPAHLLIVLSLYKKKWSLVWAFLFRLSVLSLFWGIIALILIKGGHTSNLALIVFTTLNTASLLYPNWHIIQRIDRPVSLHKLPIPSYISKFRIFSYSSVLIVFINLIFAHNPFILGKNLLLGLIIFTVFIELVARIDSKSLRKFFSILYIGYFLITLLSLIFNFSGVVFMYNVIYSSWVFPALIVLTSYLFGLYSVYILLKESRNTGG